jgi:anti-sigma B factor antagonist
MSTIDCLPEVLEVAAIGIDASGSGEFPLPTELPAKFRNQTVFINLDRVKEIDSLALALFVETKQHLAALGGNLVLFGKRPDVRRIFAMTKLDQVFPLFSSREEALASGVGKFARETACVI